MVSLQAAIIALALSGSGNTLLLDFYIDGCAPCREMNPTVESLIAKGYRVERINASQNRSLATRLNVTNFPSFVMIVDNREVDRVVGKTSLARLERMCQMGKADSATAPSPAMLAQQTAPLSPIPTPPAPANANPPAPMASPFDGWESPAQASQPAPASPVASDPQLLSASVRLRVEDPDGRSCGSGTLVDSRGGQALIVTCGHIFRDSKGRGKIEVDLFGPNGLQRAEGFLISYDSEVRDIGLVSVRVPGPVAIARVAPPGYRIEPGMSVASVGCNNGETPTVQRSKITMLNRFSGPPNIQVAGQPVEGRSGGGLFSPEGYLIGVCNAADPSDREGFFAALGSIHAELDRGDLAFIYKSSGEAVPSAGSAPPPAALAAAPLPMMPATMPGLPDATPAGVMPTNFAAPAPMLAAHEQAALDEVRRHVKEGAQVTIVIHPRNTPDAKTEIYSLERASAEFTRQLTLDSRRQDKHETSLELPRPRKILLEWSAPNGVPQTAGSPASRR